MSRSLGCDLDSLHLPFLLRKLPLPSDLLGIVPVDELAVIGQDEAARRAMDGGDLQVAPPMKG